MAKHFHCCYADFEVNSGHLIVKAGYEERKYNFDWFYIKNFIQTATIFYISSYRETEIYSQQLEQLYCNFDLKIQISNTFYYPIRWLRFLERSRMVKKWN